MNRKILWLTALPVLMLVGAWQSSKAASFDCSKAKPRDEKAICANPQLNDADVEMSVLYTQLKPLLGMGARGDLGDEQAAWLKRRAGCGGDRGRPGGGLEGRGCPQK